MDVVELSNLHKVYPARRTTTRALDGLSLNVQKGELFGLVGVNGAGKTTTLSILMGFIRASSGSARVLGLDPWRDAPALHARVAWLPGDVRLPDVQTGLEWLKYQGEMLRLEPGRVSQLALEWEVPLDRPMRTLSKGNRQKIALLRLLASPAELLILDEPTSGLDPVAQERLLQHLRERAQRGATVLFSSHSLSEVQTLCDRIAVIDRGQVVRLGSIAALTSGAANLTVWTRQPIDVAAFHAWKIHSITHKHCTLEGEFLLERAIPLLASFGIERLEYGGMSLEHLLERVHGNLHGHGNGNVHGNGGTA
jgi:ABC-2 type transport system ATP-binding protein